MGYDTRNSELQNCCLSTQQTCTKCKVGYIHDGYGCKGCDSGYSCHPVLGLQCPSGFTCGGGYYANACCVAKPIPKVCHQRDGSFNGAACGYNCDENCNCGHCNNNVGCMSSDACLGVCNSG